MQFYDIGGKISAERKARGLTQTEVATDVGITRQTLSKLERGEIGKISLLVFVKILDSLDLELDVTDKKPFYYFDAESVEE